MIVYCEKCNSKFQVDDAKIPDAGIKARCSVCSHAFLLKKEPVAVPVQTAKPAEPIKAQAAAPSDFDTSVFSDTPAKKNQNQSPLVGSGGPFFSKNAAAQQSASGDVVVEVAASANFDEEIFEAHEEEPEASSDSSATDKHAAGYDAFAAFVERQKEQAGPAPTPSEPPKFTFNTTPATAEPTAMKAAEEAAPISSPRLPEVVNATDGQLTARSERSIITKLDDQGMTDDYVVQMVQEVCQAVKYVEGMEKPDWPTRMMGLEMLCKIRGLYAGEKRDDPTNRQLQIVAGINM